jgi:FkbM family methyltransferase
MAQSAVLSNTPSRQSFTTAAKMRIRSVVGRLVMQPVVGRIAGRVFGDRIPHRKLIVITSSGLVSDQVRASLLLGGYESAEYRFVQRYIPGDASVIELGASMGVMTCHLRRRVAAPHRVISVEADRRLFKLIDANLSANTSAPVELVNKAIDYSGGTHVDFSFGDDNLGGAVRADGGATMSVESIALRDLVAQLSGDDYSLVSDIEGAEWAMWENDHEFIARARTCVFELHDAPDGRKAEELVEAIANDPEIELLECYGNVIAFGRRRLT